MRLIHDTCRLRPEVLAGALREEEFAARLNWALRPSPAAPAVYADGTLFFSRTFPTGGLQTLLRDVLGRLSGKDPAAPSIIRLETGFGGGKTHNLIALAHAVSGKVPVDVLARFVPLDRVPHGPIRTAAIVGEDLSPASGLQHEDGTTTWTPWGELAWQLGGKEAYRLLETDDRSRTVPGAAVWQRLLGDEPALIMLDELAPYLRALKTSQQYAHMAGSLAPFLKGLLETVASSRRAVCVLTLAESSDAFGQETEELGRALTELIGELKNISARIERTLTPTTGEDEIGQIVVHRLLESVDHDAARAATQAYRDAYEQWQRQGVDLPSGAIQADYAGLIERSYPLHPDVLVVLNRKTSTIPNFQRTRGALRLLALALRRAWQNRPADAWLFHLHHLDLADPDITAELTSRLDRPRHLQVVQADIASPLREAPAHAEEIDRRWTEAGRPAFARKAATAVFLHSITQGGGSGARTEEVNLAVLAPGDDPALLGQALHELERSCWHLEYEDERWRFQPEPALNKMIADEMQYVGVAAAKRDLNDRLKAIWPSGIFDVRRFPAEPDDIPDDGTRPRLAVMHYDAASAREEDGVPPDLVRHLYERAGASGGLRTYQNSVIFLVADAAQIPRMIDAARYGKAVSRLADDPEKAKHLSAEQRKRLRERKDTSLVELRLAIHRTYRFLYYPSAEAPRAAAGLAREPLPAQDQGDIERDQSQVILDALRRLEKVYIADDPPIAPQFIKSRAWPAGRPAVRVGDIARAFGMRRGLRMLLDSQPLRQGILEGVRRGLWIYYDPQEGVGYGVPSPTPFVDLGGEGELLEPAEAQTRGVRIKGEQVEEERCPVCGQPASACVCGSTVAPPPTERLHAEGAIDQALQAVVDQMHDRNVEALSRLTIQVRGQGTSGLQELRSLGLAVPQLGSGTYRLDVRVAAELGAADSLRLEFRGPWDRYRRLKDGLEALLAQAARLDATAALECGFDGEGGTAARLTTIRDVLRTLNVGRVEVSADPFKE
ncbi:MAG: DUF499 domain-containing protein [Armatimonadota bacterium]|nr:DUF499 domain-containing protein [Armatimonadota bacterium]